MIKSQKKRENTKGRKKINIINDYSRLRFKVRKNNNLIYTHFI